MKRSLPGGIPDRVAIASTDNTISYAAAVPLITMTTQLMLQILPQHLDEREFRRVIPGFIHIPAVCVYEPDICLPYTNKPTFDRFKLMSFSTF